MGKTRNRGADARSGVGRPRAGSRSSGQGNGAPVHYAGIRCQLLVSSGRRTVARRRVQVAHEGPDFQEGPSPIDPRAHTIVDDQRLRRSAQLTGAATHRHQLGSAGPMPVSRRCRADGRAGGDGAGDGARARNHRGRRRVRRIRRRCRCRYRYRPRRSRRPIHR